MKGLHQQLQAIYEEKLRNPRTFEQLIANRVFVHFSKLNLQAEDCLIEEVYIDSLRVIMIKPNAPIKQAPCFIWFHGGGMVVGSPDDSISYMLDFVRIFQAVVIIPQYRLAPEHPYPAAVEDGYKTLQWVEKEAESLQINKKQIIVSGGSAGGNLALAVSLMARDKNGPKIAFILPLYPMIDAKFRRAHSNFTSPAIWNIDKNTKSWIAYLKNVEDVPSYASPLYANLNGLPPIYTFIGTHDLFYDEVLEFTEKLKVAQVPITFHLYEGCTHGFDLEDISIGKEAKSNLLEATAQLIKQTQ